MLPKPKTPYKKAILDKTKTSHQRFLESPEGHVLGFFEIFGILGIFCEVIFTLDQQLLEQGYIASVCLKESVFVCTIGSLTKIFQ